MKQCIIIILILAIVGAQKCCTSYQWLNKQDEKALKCEKNPIATETGFDTNCYTYEDNKSGVPQCLECKASFQMNMASLCVADLSYCSTQKNFEECTDCATGYYLTNKLCVKNPTPLTPPCLVHLTDTQCVSCEDGSYLNAADKTCSLQPAYETSYAIINCIIYESVQMCAICYGRCFPKAGSAGAAGTCEVAGIATSNPNYDKCLTFTSSQDCATCFDEYYLEGTPLLCVNTVPILNCKVYETPTKCGQCKDTFYLATDQASCKLVSTITNCITVNKEECDLCKAGFYQNTEKKACVANAVLNCSVQTESAMCKVCDNMYEISYDGKSCISCPKDLTTSTGGKTEGSTGKKEGTQATSAMAIAFPIVTIALALVLA